MSYGIATTVNLPYDEAMAAAKDALTGVGFGVLTEIDMAATLKKKLDVDLAPYSILGCCMPSMAHQAVEAEPSIGLLLPCNVVIRALDDSSTRVEAIDTATMVELTGNPEMAPVAAQVGAKMQAALDALPAQ